MSREYPNKFNPYFLLALLFFVFICRVCPPVDYAVFGQSERAAVTQVDNTTDNNGKPIASVHYRFTDQTHFNARNDCRRNYTFERDESTALGPGDPIPAVGDTITIQYVSGEPGVSRVWHYQDHHEKLMLILMLAIFILGVVLILRQNKYTEFKPSWENHQPH